MQVQQSSGLAFGLALAVLFAFGFNSSVRAEGYGFAQQSRIEHARVIRTSGFRERSKRIARYRGPSLGLSQISRVAPAIRKRMSRRVARRRSYVRQALAPDLRKPVGIRQLDAYKGWVNYPKNSGLPEDKEQICALPYGSYTFESLFVPSIPGVLPIAVITSQSRKVLNIDPRLLLAKPVDKNKELFEKELETAPDELGLSDDVLYHY